MAATHYTYQQLSEMDAEIRAFLYFWVQERNKQQILELGRLLGAFFTAGEIRAWGSNDKGTYRDEDPILIPLSLAIKPELRDGLRKMVGGVALPEGYAKGANEVVVDLGQVSTQEFIEFIEKHRPTSPK